MNDRDIQEFNSATRMTEIVAANNTVFAGNAKAVELTAALNADIDVLEAAGAARVSASGLRTDGTMDKRAARDALEDFLRKIASNAKTIKKAEPDFNNTFKIPLGSLSGQQLLDTANGFKNDLTAAAIAKFGEYGFTAAKPVNIQNKVDDFEAARVQQNTGKGGGVAATAETKAAIKRLKANRRTLKTIGENILEENGDAGLIAEWKSACKIEKSASKPPAAPPAPPNP
jgi:hypothetical protein